MDSKLDGTQMNGSGLWIDETNAKAWAEACGKEIAKWFSVIAGEDPVDGAFVRNLHVEVRPPTKNATRKAFGLNRTLTGEVRFRWLDQEEGFHLPTSYHGAFLYHREGSFHPLVSVWPSWLTERHAFRVLLPTSRLKRENGIAEWRLGLPDGTWIGAPLLPMKKLSPAERKRIGRKKETYIGVPDAPDWLARCLSVFGPTNFGDRKSLQSPAAVWESIHKLVLEKFQSGNLPAPAELDDEDDLNHQRLITFPVWLRQQISDGLLATLQPRIRSADKPPKPRKMSDVDWELVWQTELIRRETLSVLRGNAKGTAELADKARIIIWGALRSLAAKINRAITNYQSEERTDYVDPINPLDLVARITRVRRIHLPASRLEEKPAEFRQNHPSFEGRICPVESPESGQVGLTVHLASGASVDSVGRIQKATTPAGALGFGAGLIPFFAHNDGTRDMMGAKNLRQAIPVRDAQPPAVLSGGEGSVTEFVKPLLDLKICPPASDENGRFCVGRDLLVAYLPWYGLNMEDAIVLSESAAVQLGCEGLRKPPVRETLALGWAPVVPERPAEFPDLDGNGLIRPGTKVYPGTPLACIGWEETKKRTKQRIIRYEERTPAIVKRIEFIRKYEWMKGTLEYELELLIPVRPGDKLMGRHGNKGVVGTILPDGQMPRLPDDQNLPKTMRKRAIDILLNPHGVIGRMNLGQLIETHLAWLLHSNTCTVEQILKDGIVSGSLPGAPFSDVLDYNKVQEGLASTGLDRYGRIKLKLPDGRETLAPVTVGFQHIVRLRHIPELKSQARRGGGDALYSARTGQAVRGRKHGGGQRVGEMEIWALSGHQADAVLDEMLGIKSSGELMGSGTPSAPAGYSGYSQVFKDWLFAMGIDLRSTDEEVTLSFLDDEKVTKRVGKENQVTSAASIQSKVAASFKCSMGTKRHPCGYQPINGELIAFSVPKGNKEATLRLKDVLTHLQFAPAGKFVKTHTGYQLPLCDIYTRTSAGVLEFTFTLDGEHLEGLARFSIAAPSAPASQQQLSDLAAAMAEPEWAKRKPLPEIHLYGRFGKGTNKGGGNWSAAEVLEQFQMDEPSEWVRAPKMRNRCVTDLQVACQQHHRKAAFAAKPFDELFFTTPGGLLDPRIFGSYTTAFGTSRRWGYIELPLPVEFPLHVFLTKSGKEEDQKAAVEKFLEKLRDQGITPPELPKLTRIPVLPVRYRLPARSRGRIVRDNLETLGYIPLLQACKACRKSPEKAEVVAKQVAWLFRHLASAMNKKSGLIRQDGLGRRVDRSARLVITPNPKLPWDQAGLPTAVLFELMGDKVREWRQGLSPEDAKSLPEVPSVSWLELADREQALQDAQKLLEVFLARHPDFVVLLNRQPSLHRDSFQAFKPKPLPSFAGDVIQLCPLSCKGFAADFDGDEMVIHVPLGELAQADARRLLPSKNLFSLASLPDDGENVLAHFDQDFVMGTWFLGAADPLKLRNTFLALLPDGEVKGAAEAWGAHPTKADGGRLLAAISRKAIEDKHPEQAAAIIEAWMTVALKACSEAGVSFGFLELREIAGKLADKVREECDKQRALIRTFTRRKIAEFQQTKEGEPDYNAGLESLAFSALDELLNSAFGTNAQGFGFAAMAISGAKGKKEQVRQIIAARGLLDPGKAGFDAFKYGREHFFIQPSLCGGLDPKSMFWAAMNARSSIVDKKLGTGHAGGLTRSLVFALWPYEITAEHCGNTEENPITCKVEHGICSKCYGKLPDESPPLSGYPAGLIAAQSIGERGTQLSMQSFHAGKSAIDIHTARDVIKKPLDFSEADTSTFAGFLKFLKSAKAYEKILDRHFAVLWKAMSEADGTLTGAIRNHDAMNLIGYNHTASQVIGTVMANRSSKRTGPIARLLTGKSPTEAKTKEDK